MPLCCQVINVENIHSFEQPARTIQYCTPLLILSRSRILLWYRFRTGCRVADVAENAKATCRSLLLRGKSSLHTAAKCEDAYLGLLCNCLVSAPAR